MLSHIQDNVCGKK